MPLPPDIPHKSQQTNRQENEIERGREKKHAHNFGFRSKRVQRITFQFSIVCVGSLKPIFRSSTWAYAGRSLVAIDSTSNWNRHEWRPTTCLRTHIRYSLHSTARCTMHTVYCSLAQSLGHICMRLAACVLRSNNISEFSAVVRGPAKRIQIEMHGSRFVNTILLFSARHCLCSGSMFYFCQSLKCCFNYDNTVNVWLMHSACTTDCPVWSWIAACDVFTWCNFRSLLAFFR